MLYLIRNKNYAKIEQEIYEDNDGTKYYYFLVETNIHDIALTYNYAFHTSRARGKPVYIMNQQETQKFIDKYFSLEETK